MVTKLFQLLLLLSPIMIGVNTSLDMLDMIFFRTGVIALFMASLLDTPKRKMTQELVYSLLGLLGLGLINIFINTFAPVTMMNFQNLFLGILGFYIVYVYWDETQDIKKYILFAGFINLLLFISQRIGFDPIFDKRSDPLEAGAFLGNKQRMITYFALLTPFLWTPLLVISVIIGIYTKQIIIFIPVILCLWMKIKNKRENIGFWIVVFLAIFLLREKIICSLSFRFNIAWKPAIELLFKRPFLGYGLGVRVIPDLEVLSNSYLQFIMGIGILGAIWLGYVFKKLWKGVISDVSMMSLILIMFVEYVLETPRLWFLIVAIILRFLIKKNKKEVVCS